MWIVICIAAIIVVYLYCIAPNTGRQEQMKPFTEVYIAHRGLFNNGDGEWKIDDEASQGNVNIPHSNINNSESENAADNIEIIPENSLPAFERAVAAGYGIELDTQTTKDGRLVVFHDETLYRMCGVDKKLYECTYDELRQYGLAGTDYKIPLFDEVLKAIGGRVPLIVEVKSEGNWRRTTRMTAERLDTYGRITGDTTEDPDLSVINGHDKHLYCDTDVRDSQYKGKLWMYCIESFHPLVVKWFRDNRPDVLRGQLSTNFFRSTLKRAWYENVILTNLMMNFLSRPDFVAYNYRYRNQPSFFICRHLFKVVSAAWTVRSEAVIKKVSKVFDVIIFDSFLPGKREDKNIIA